MRPLWMLASGLLAAAPPANASPSKGDPSSLLRKAGFSLSEALAKAVPHSEGGIVVSAELEEIDGRILYSMEVARADRTLELSLDARTGEVVTKESLNEDRSAVAKAGKITPAQAVLTALERVPGQAYSVSSGVVRGRAEIEVRILAQGRVAKVVVDGSTGEVMKVKTPKGDSPGPEKRDDRAGNG